MTSSDALAQDQENAVQKGMGKLSIKDFDSLFKDNCFLFGDVRCLETTTSGITTALQTMDDGLSENCCCAHLQAPEGIVCPGVGITVHYAVLLEGPFNFPKGYCRVSSVLFLHCNKPNQLQKEVTIRLHHWVDICRGNESGLCFMKASHELCKGDTHYSFSPLEGGNFEADQRSGTIHLKDHFCLICIAIEDSKGYTSDRCYAVLCCKRDKEFRICIAYAVPSWLEVSHCM